MLLDLAESLTPLLKARRDRVTSNAGILRDGFDEEESSDTTLTILFLDGEEAFHDWTDTDSIYGARHLSQLWEDTYPPSFDTDSALGKRRYDPISTYIETIDHFVLLDLLGNKHSRLHSYYRETDWLFDEMSDADRRLREQGLVEVEKGEKDWFQKLRMRPGMIGDDHLPVSLSLGFGAIWSLTIVCRQGCIGPSRHFESFPKGLAHSRCRFLRHVFGIDVTRILINRMTRVYSRCLLCGGGIGSCGYSRQSTSAWSWTELKRGARLRQALAAAMNWSVWSAAPNVKI
jgi:hypothetical protein